MPPVTNKVTGPGEAAFVGESEQFNGLLGYSTADGHAGVCGVSDSGNSNGIVGRSKQANGVLGLSAATGHAGVAGANDDGDGQGVYGRSAKSDGVLGISASTGHAGVSGVNDDGDGPGLYGHSTKNDGVLGITTGDDKAGVTGVCESAKGNGVFGRSKAANGVVGNSSSATHAGVAGTNDNATGVGIFGKGSRLAGLFAGQVEITGDLDVAGEIKQEGMSLLALIAVLRQQVESLTARVVTLEKEEGTPDSPTGTIRTTGASGARKIVGEGFKKGASYRIRVLVGALGNETSLTGTASHSGGFSRDVPADGIPPGTTLLISATDGTRSHTDLTGFVWSNTLELTLP